MKAAAAIIGIALAAALFGADRASAGEPVVDRVELGASESAVAAQRARWEARIADARAAVVDAHLRHIEAMEAYGRMRHRDRDRGEEKVAILDELRDAEAALAKAVAAMNAVLESARRAGVPRGWLPDSYEAPAALEGANGGR